MKILKPGRAQQGWANEFSCTGKGNSDGGCDAVLLVEQADLFWTYSHVRDERTMYVTFKCAACGVLTDIPQKEWPNSIIQRTLPDQKTWEANQEETHG